MNKHIEEHDIIIKSLTEALFVLMNVKPFSEITVTELIQRAGVARSTYYRNFSSKEDIISLFFQGIFSEFQSTYPVKSLEERYKEEHVTHVLEFMFRYSDKIKILNKAGVSSYYLKYLNEYLISLYAKPRMSLKETFHIYAIAGAEYNLVFNWYISEHQGSAEAIKDYLSKRKSSLTNIAGDWD